MNQFTSSMAGINPTSPGPVPGFHKGWRITLSLVFLLTACGIAPKKAAVCPTFPVGVVIASDSIQAAQEQKEGYELALSEIQKAGGVKSCPVSLIYNTKEGDSSSPDNVQSAMLELSDGGVVAILGATSNDAAKRVAAIAAYIKTPVLITPPTADDLFEGGNQWIFRVSPPDKSNPAVAFDLLKTSRSASLGISPSAAIFYEHTEYGESAAVTAGEAALNQGLKIASYKGFSLNTKDFSSLFQEIKQSEVDVIYLISSNPTQALALVAAVKNQKLVTTFLVGSGSGFTARTFLYDQAGKINPGLENLIVPASWSEDLPWKGAKEFGMGLNAFKKAGSPSGALLPPTIQTVQAYVSLHLLVDAVNDTASNDPAKNTPRDWNAVLSDPIKLAQFREEIAQVLHGYRTGQRQTIMGPVEFDGTGQNKSDVVLVEIIGSKVVTVYPQKYAVHAVVTQK